MKIKVLIVGAGGYGSGYVRALTSRDYGAEIAGVVDVMENVNVVCPQIDEHRIPVYRTLADFYKEHTADLAILASPIHLHTPMSIECMKNGSNVLCEKPLCLTTEEIESLDKCCLETGKFLAVGYQMNYRSDVQALKKDILSGKFGSPLRAKCLHTYRRGSIYYARNNWAGRISVNGHEVFDSPFTNACAHNFQLLTFLFGKDAESACNITGVKAEMYRGNENVENYDIACMRFSTDIGADILYYTAHPISSEVFGPYARIEFEKAVVEYGVDHRITARMATGEVIDYGEADLDAYHYKLENVIACIKKGKTPACTTKSEFGHVRAVRMVQALPIEDIDKSHVDIVQDERRGTCYHVKNLEEYLKSSFDNWALPKEIGIEL